MLFTKNNIKGSTEYLTPTVIAVVLAVILTVVILITVLGQYFTTKTFLAEYSTASTVKGVTYKFISCFSGDTYGILDTKKLDETKDLNPCIGYENLDAIFLVKDLFTNKNWRFGYKGSIPLLPELPTGMPTGYEISKHTIFVSLNYPNEKITSGVLNVEVSQITF